MAARRIPPRRGVSGDCARTDGATRSEPIASAKRVTSVIGHLPSDDPAVSASVLEPPGRDSPAGGSPPATQGRDPGSEEVLQGYLRAGGSNETRATSSRRPV